MPGSRESLTPRNQGSGDSSIPNSLPTSSVVCTSVPVHGFTQLGFRSYPTGSYAPEAITTTYSCYGYVRPVYSTTTFRPVSPCQLTPTLAFFTSGIPIRPFHAEITIFTDASTQGWGAHMDNTTVVSDINKQGGTYSLTLLCLVVNCFLWLQAQDILIRARHILGCLNVIADLCHGQISN